MTNKKKTEEILLKTLQDLKDLFVKIDKKLILYEKYNSNNIYRTKVIFTTQDVAKILQISKDEIWRLIKEDHIKAFRLREGKKSPWRIRRKDLDDYINRRLERGSK